jgi:hypothetical protein
MAVDSDLVSGCIRLHHVTLFNRKTVPNLTCQESILHFCMMDFFSLNPLIVRDVVLWKVNKQPGY